MEITGTREIKVSTVEATLACQTTLQDASDRTFSRNGSIGKRFPLSYNQKALWFIYQMTPDSAAYNVYSTVRLSGSIDRGIWQWAWQCLVDRHELLRTTYATENGQPIQVIHPSQPAFAHIIDVSSLTKEQLHKRILADAETPFDLERGPVMRISLYVRSPQESIQLVTLHEIAGEMRSIDILLREFRMLYLAMAPTASRSKTPSVAC